MCVSKRVTSKYLSLNGFTSSGKRAISPMCAYDDRRIGHCVNARALCARYVHFSVESEMAKLSVGIEARAVANFHRNTEPDN